MTCATGADERKERQQSGSLHRQGGAEETAIAYTQPSVMFSFPPTGTQRCRGDGTEGAEEGGRWAASWQTVEQRNAVQQRQKEGRMTWTLIRRGYFCWMAL